MSSNSRDRRREKKKKKEARQSTDKQRRRKTRHNDDDEDEVDDIYDEDLSAEDAISRKQSTKKKKSSRREEKSHRSVRSGFRESSVDVEQRRFEIESESEPKKNLKLRGSDKRRDKRREEDERDKRRSQEDDRVRRSQEDDRGSSESDVPEKLKTAFPPTKKKKKKTSPSPRSDARSDERSSVQEQGDRQRTIRVGDVLISGGARSSWKSSESTNRGNGRTAKAQILAHLKR